MYYFLIASLPTLEIGTAAEFSTAEFDEMMQEYLGAKELEKLCSCSGGAGIGAGIGGAAGSLGAAGAAGSAGTGGFLQPDKSADAVSLL